jgi:hypothetical protein
MLHLVNPDTTPPGAFTYHVKETGADMKGDTLYAITERVKAHLVANKLPAPPNLVDLIVDETCKRIPPHWCEEDDPVKRYRRNWALTWEVLKAGTTTIGSWVAAGLPKVSQEKADARGAVCVMCRENIPADSCAPCQAASLTNLIHSLIGTDRSVHHDKLRACGCCGCALAVKVWTPLEHVIKGEPLAPYPPNCWIENERRQ